MGLISPRHGNAGIHTVTGSTEPVSFHGAGLEHRLYVLAAVLTHALVGYAFISLLDASPPLAGLVGAILPDIDLLFAPAWSFPFVHRGLTHTPLCGAVITGVIWLGTKWTSGQQSLPISDDRGLPTALLFGYGSHLLLDSFTVSGVPWLYPMSTVRLGVDAEIHGFEASLLLWLCCTVILVRRRRSRDGTTQ
ncbi:metal-dependent hydrolase [Haloarcula sp. JP-L23]|uniref:metal-dependent hydrolase n=1 Tax=Haloarcula sp. JP-L23 TaxID=2716717 RepID=UPI00140E98B7|nr:metal-dependent hydrolase [Haloarcula sp. JP-L23]